MTRTPPRSMIHRAFEISRRAHSRQGCRSETRASFVAGRFRRLPDRRRFFPVDFPGGVLDFPERLPRRFPNPRWDEAPIVRWTFSAHFLGGARARARGPGPAETD